MAQAKLWEEAFLKEMQDFQNSTADKFRIAFSAEVGTPPPPPPPAEFLVPCLPSLIILDQFQSNAHPGHTYS